MSENHKNLEEAFSGVTKEQCLSTATAAALEAFFRLDDWKYEKRSETVFRTGLSGSVSSYKIFYHIKDGDMSVIFYSPVDVPKKFREKVAEFLVRANYNTRWGHFDMDMEDGEWRFRLELAKDIAQQDKEIKLATYRSAFSMDKYYPGVMTIIYANKSPKEAIEECEKEEDETEEETAEE